MAIDYQLEPDLTWEAFRDLLVRSTLGERRPIDRPEVLQRMLAQADIIATARNNGVLVGISRALTDFAFCTYLSDLAVDESYQRQGIGQALLQFTHKAAGLHTTLILLAAPKAQSYYPHIGMAPHPSCWITPAK